MIKYKILTIAAPVVPARPIGTVWRGHSLKGAGGEREMRTRIVFVRVL